MNTISYRWLQVISLAVVISGCSNGGDAPTINAPTPLTQTAAGFWTASAVSIANQPHDIDCLVSATQAISCRLFVNTENFVAAMNGELLVNGQNVSGSGRMYRSQSRALPDGSSISDLTVLGGIVDEFNTLNLTIEAAGEQFTSSFQYNTDVHDRGSALETVAGVYSIFNFLGETASFTVDPDGTIASQSDSGCACNGQVGIINSEFNAYDVALDVSNCGTLDGSYVGLGLTTFVVVRDNAEAQDPTSNDVFLFNVFTDQAVIDGTASK